MPLLNNIMVKSIFRPWKWFQTPPVIVEVKRKLTGKDADNSLPLPKIILIHGANQSNMTFEYLRHVLPWFSYISLDHDAYAGFYNNLDGMIKLTRNLGPTYIIGHSLGGIYAAHLAQHVDCIGGATLSTPFGGWKTANWVKYMLPEYPIFREIGTKSTPILEAQQCPLPGRWTNYVSTRGDLPGLGGKNDCVVGVDSMESRTDIYTKYIHATHYEIVLNTGLIHQLGQDFLRASEKYQTSLDK